MPAPLPPPVWPFGLLLARDARAEGWGGRLQSAARRRELVKVRPGVYIASERWSAMSPEDRHRARIRAAALVCENIIFSHQSAAVVHGLPVLRSRLVRLHTLQLTPAGSGSRGDITVHAFSGDPDIVVRDGVRVTSPARTVLDLARTLPHGEALAAADAAIRPASSLGSTHGAGAPMCSLSELADRAHAVADARGGRAVALVVDEADPRSGSLGESLARSLFLRLGAPRPELQTAHRDDAGLIGYSDFFWRDLGVVGEFDGRLKYGADNPSGLPPEEVVYREKRREDRLRRVVRHVFRFGWDELQDPPRLAGLLQAAGIPLDRRLRASSAHLRRVGSAPQPT